MDDDIKNEVQPETVEKEKYLRLAADFENFRKQESSMRQDLAKWSAQAVITDMLELVDLVDAAVAHAPPEARTSAAWYGGLEQVGKQFLEKMKRYGVTKIETIGKSFDPNQMEAVAMVEGGESQLVKEEVRAGYLMHDRVIRPARVAVYQ